MKKSLVKIALNIFFYGTSKTRNLGFAYPIRHYLVHYIYHGLERENNEYKNSNTYSVVFNVVNLHQLRAAYMLFFG